MDLLQQQDRPRSNNADPRRPKLTERAVVRACVLVGCIGVTMLLTIALKA